MKESTDLVRPVFNQNPDWRLSQRYTLIETRPVIEALAPLGWEATSSAVMRRNKGSSRSVDTAKHLVRLQRPADRTTTDIPQVVIVNSHDGSSPWLFLIGLHVWVCSNGCISNREGWTTRLKHIGLTLQGVIDSILSLAGKFPELLAARDAYQAIKLTDGQALDFATRAIRLRFDESVQVSPLAVLRNPYVGQEPSTLWGCYQTVQRHLLGGGFHSYDSTRKGSGIRKARPINAIGESVNVNRGLWELLDSFGNALTPAVPYGWNAV